MKHIDTPGRSFLALSLGGWLVILGTAVIFGPQDVYAVGSAIPLVGGLRLTILPAATIAAIKLSGSLAITAVLLLVTVAAVHRAVARRRQGPASRIA